MKTAWVTDINNRVYKQFPEMVGVQPKIQTQGNNYLLIYQNSVQLPTGSFIQRVVRAVVDGTGKLIKVSTSR